MRIGDEIYVHGYVDEIRQDTVIIRNDGGYFGTDPAEIRSWKGRLIEESEIETVVNGVFNSTDRYSPYDFLKIIKDQCIPIIDEIKEYEAEERVKDWHDIPAEEMTEDQLRQAVKDLRMGFLKRIGEWT